MNKIRLPKKLLVLIAIGLLFTFELHAKKIDGQIIFENDTVDVVFNIPLSLFGKKPVFQKLQYKVKYYNNSGKKQVLKPEQAREIRFNYDAELVRMLSRVYKDVAFIFASNKMLFLKLEVDGEVKMFSYYETRRSPGSPYMYTHNIQTELIQKGEGELKRPKELAFRNDMTAYFSDCPDLAQQIKARDFTKADLASIVKFYNANCGE